ncbi:hypothetical protein [Roseomonas sp. CECT 9278]|uniref:glycosyltransferase n=1 Tax=Roseomonas sp. CECT 9278 TaxID=2845823 RepID=UPI001E4ABC9B|nr:hypothetical protein [Roseomonas sp. CECT 9278]CAH0194131.1 hypothetical protein ROS9278_01758 [Roseomonas sp. CECT 9278]
MYLNVPGEVPFAPPWDLPFAARQAQLGRGRPRIAYFYERPDTSTFRYRVHNMIEALEHVGAAAAWFCRDDLGAMPGVLDRADVLVLCRTRYSDGIAALVAQARARGVPVLFDVDDLVFDVRHVQLVLETLDQRPSEAAWDHWFGYIGRLGAALRLCDGAITTNATLAARIHDFAGIAAAVVPNFLNTAQAAFSRRILAAKQAGGFARDRTIHVGYFSGTPTHNRDFAIVRGAIAELMHEDPRIRLRLVGFLEPGGPLSGLRERIDVFPLQDFLNLQRLVAEVEVNIVPLQDNLFTNCKSELKYFEAAVVGTVSVASPTSTLAASIRHDETGFLAAAQAWPVILREVVARIDALPRIAAKAADMANDAYAPERHGRVILDALAAHGVPA